MIRGLGACNLLVLGVILLGVVPMSNADEKTFAKQPPTVAEAEAFIKNAEAKLLALSVTASRADWVKATCVTDDTIKLAG
jgi:peptidyl-dipeptidase A